MNEAVVSDKTAMDVLTKWIEDQDPVLDGDLPNWVWDLVTLVDDLIDDTGRNSE